MNRTERAVAIFDKMKKEEEDGIQPINRPKDWQLDERRKEKQRKRHTWSTQGGYIAPIIIPSTPNSELLTMLREVAEAESEKGLRFKILERGGLPVKRKVQNSNPTATTGCQSGDCLACKGESGQSGMCRKSNVQYQMHCNLCVEDSQCIYVGETARNLYTRSKEHVQNYRRRRNGESFMKKHQMDRHHGAEADFGAKVTGVFRDCLSRQVSEGVFIKRSPHEVLNGKSEWHQPSLWRVRTELTND